MSQAFGVRDTCEILWLTKQRFIAHQVYVEGIPGKNLEEKETAAEAKWDRDLRNVEIRRRGSGDETQLGVAGLPRTQGFRERESRREVACSDSIHSKSEMRASLQSLAEHGITQRALTGEAMGDFGAVFAQGASSYNGDALAPTLPPRNASSVPYSVVCEPAVLEPPLGFSGTHGMPQKKET